MSSDLLSQPSRQPSRQHPVQRVAGSLLRSREASIAAVLLILIVATTIKSPEFVFSHDGWRDLWLSPSILLLLAIGEMVVVVTRNVDLSVGSVLGLGAYLTGRVFIDHPGIPIVLVFVIGLAFGALLGSINGLLVTMFKVPSLVITLGTMYVYRGVLVHWAGSNQIYAQNLPNSFQNLGTAQFLGLPVLTLLGLVVLAVVGYYLWNARGGRELYAIGSDPDAAELFGLPVRRRVFGAFVLSGALAGLAGVVDAARYSTATSSTGQGLELQAVAAVVIGGVAIFGGSGSVYGAALGAFLLITIDSVLPILGIPEFWQNAVVGALILSSICLDRYLAQRRAHRLIESRDEA
jgi:rhamnose transport system permease protein